MNRSNRVIKITNSEKWVEYVEQSLDMKIATGHYFESDFTVEDQKYSLKKITLFITQCSVTELRDGGSLHMTFTAYVKLHTGDSPLYWTYAQGEMSDNEVWITI